jgi:Flp pilus assembly protein TadD
VGIFDGQTGQEVVTLKEAPRECRPTFSPDGKRLALAPDSATKDSVVPIYDTLTGQETLKLKGPVPLGHAAFHPKGSRLALESRDGVVRVFDVGTGQEVFALKGLMYLSQAVFSPDGSRVAAAGSDGFLHVFDAPKDLGGWQSQRRTALAEGALAWHRLQAIDHEQAGHWFTAAFHLSRLIRSEPPDGQLYFRRGRCLANHGKVAEAQQDFEKALTLKNGLSEVDQATAHAELRHWEKAATLYARAAEAPDTSIQIWRRHVLLQQLLLQLHLGRPEGYADSRAALMKRFGTTKDPSVANDVAWTCALCGETIPDLKSVVELARVAVQGKPNDGNVRNTLGAILYRAGQHQEAVIALNEGLVLKGTDGSAHDFLFLAMAHHRLGQADEAKKWWDKTVQAIEKAPPVAWDERLELDLLRREAEQVLSNNP